MGTAESVPVIRVTGAGRGLGRGIATELARAGMSVAIHYGSSRKGAEETATQCGELATNENQEFHLIQGDLSAPEARREILPSTVATFGHIDALINNAGITEPNRRDCLYATEEDYDAVMLINLKAAYFLIQATARWMIDNPDNRRLPHYQILNISSISSSTVSINRGAYCISKAGLTMATTVWAARLAEHQILVNDLQPGIMSSDMTTGAKEKYDALLSDGDLVPLARWGNGTDLGKATVALLSGSFPFTTGHVIPVDGGFHLRRI